MNVKIKKLNPDAKLPERGTPKSAAYDLFACIPDTVFVNPHETVKIGTGLAMALPEDYFAAIYARSGLSTKEGLRPANCVGVCDADYRGEYIVAVHNDSWHERLIRPGEKIAQLILQKKYEIEFEEVDELDSTERGEGGFGSTGMN